MVGESPSDVTITPGMPLEEQHVSPYRPLRTVAAGVLVFCVGMTGSVLGPTLVNMRDLLSTSTLMMSVAVSMHHVGLLAGTLLSGCLFQRFNAELQFCTLTLLAGCCFLSAPWFSTVYGFMTMMTLFGCIIAYVDAGGKVYILSIWESSAQKNAILLTLHFLWCIGSITSPFLQKPFLVNKLVANQTLLNGTINDTASSVNPDDATTIMSQQINSSVSLDVSSVRYAYMLLGSFILVASVLFFIVYAFTCPKVKTIRTSDTAVSPGFSTPERTCFVVSFGVLLFLFSFLLLVGIVTGAYLSMFVVEGLGWTVKNGASITSTYYGALGLGILLAIPMSYLLLPKTVLNLCLTLQCVGYAVMLSVDRYGPELMYGSVAITGLGNSVIFPNLLLWVSNFYHLSGTVTIVITGASVGVISGLPLLGNLIKVFGHMCFVYFLLSASSLLIIIAIIMQIYVHVKVKPEQTTVSIPA